MESGQGSTYFCKVSPKEIANGQADEMCAIMDSRSDLLSRPEQSIPTGMELTERIQVWSSELTVCYKGRDVRNVTLLMVDQLSSVTPWSACCGD